MARLRLLKPYDGALPGDVISLPGGVASVLIRDRIAEFATDTAPAANAQKAVVLEPKGVEVPSEPEAKAPRAPKPQPKAPKRGRK